MSCKKTIHVTYEFGEDFVGGIGSIINELYSAHKDNEFFLFISSREDSTKYSKYSNVDIVDLNKLPNGGKVHLDDFIDDGITDIVIHSFQLLKSFTIDQKKYKVHYVVHSMPTIEKLYNMFPDEYIQAFSDGVIISDNLITVSNYERDRLNGIIELNKFKDKKVHVVYNGVDNDKPKIKKFNKSKTIGYMGRIDGRKGILNLLNRMKNLPEYNLKIAGGGLMNVYVYNQLIPYRNLLDNIDFLGFCVGERKKAFFEAIDYLVVPSVYEPFGLTVLESIQHGVLPIVPSYGGPIEIMGEDYPYQFDPNKEGTLERVLEEIENTSKEDLINQIEKNYDLLDKFSTENMVNGYRDIIEGGVTEC